MAPEQAAGQADRIGPWTDLYSVGVVFFEMLTGRLPFEGPALAVLGKILHESPPALGSVRPYLDPRLGSGLLTALHKDPGGRSQTARQFSDALEALALAGPTTTYPQLPGPREELRQAGHPLSATRLNEYVTRLQKKGFTYLLPA